ncbi:MULTISPECIES: hypothetical protein [Photorhabdus]|uniref:hypothetical protein n=1 Tax=Photorhabdus TaxID=29487 RepID=UPI0030DA94C0
MTGVSESSQQSSSLKDEGYTPAAYSGWEVPKYNRGNPFPHLPNPSYSLKPGLPFLARHSFITLSTPSGLSSTPFSG